MAVTWLDPGGSATGGIEFLTSATAGVTAQTSVNNGQPYAYQFDTGATPSNREAFSTTNTLAAAGARVSVYTRLPALPTGNTNVMPVGIVPTASTTNILGVFIGSDGLLRLYTNGVTTICGAAGSTVLSVNTWYRITLSYTITTTTNWSAKVYINGTLEMTRTNADATLSSASPVRAFYTAKSGAGTNYLMYLSDIYIDDTADQTDPAAGTGNGELHVTAKLPTTNTTNGFDTVIGTGAVNERPVDTANGWRHNATTDVSQDYEIQTASAGDVDISSATLIDSMGWIWATLGSLTGTPSTNIIVNGAAIAGTWDPASANVAQRFTTIIGSGASYPANANGKNIGSTSSVLAADTFLYDCGVVIAYIPPSAGGATTFPSQRLPLLGVG